MRFGTLLLGATLAWPCASMAINKCIGADGKAVFQDAPCAGGQGGKIEVRPSRGSAPPAAPAQSPAVAPSSSQLPASPVSETERLRALSRKLNRENRLVSLQHAIPSARGAVDEQKRRCDAQLAALQRKKLASTNNLAGATWEQSISMEMSALAQRCDTEIRTLSDNVDRLLREQSEIKAELGK